MAQKTRILYTEEQVTTAINRMASEISADYAGRDIVLVGVLTGGYFLTAYLATAIERLSRVRSCSLDFVRTSSYGHNMTGGALKIDDCLQTSIAGENVIIVDDVADRLVTIGALHDLFLTKKPLTLKTAVLVEKPDKHERHDVPLDYVGFCEENLGFLVGGGMDDKLDERKVSRGKPFIIEITEQ